MNTDIRIAVSFRNHRKRKRLRLLLGPGATDYLLDLWIATAMNHPDGVLSGMDETDIALEAGWEGDPAEFCRALLECKFMDQDEGGVYFLHDWEDHQPWVVKAEARSEKARNAVNARWEQEKKSKKEESMPQTNGHECQRDTTSIPEECSGDTPFLSFPLLSLPESKSNTLVGDQAADACADEGKLKPPRVQIPYSEVMQFWNTICGPRGKPRITELSETRKRKIRSLWRERPTADFRELETWAAFLNWCTKSELLMDGAWFTFDWLLKPENFLKITEGNYHLAPGGRKKAWGSQ